ncbi:hypothetical protein [Leptothoe spongobia]|uniref:Uncharacterized protein n=1 Tax=Leptothoe spongobia TAU-MAC 1115 TaxID=1967444 RepID=A0A947DEH2_9CYAN|nr:hypothetical protein [Leptothoe spongobia]MBT9315542.1 hypothetical protein [Leptothoe spongobia TAU-MAC 1115]
MKPLLAISTSLSSALVFFCPVAQAQYDSFNPPLGFYIDYGCSSEEGLEQLDVTLFTTQGGLFLTSGESDFPEFWAGSQELGPIADYNEFGEPWAWEYQFTGSSEDEALSYDIVLLDQWNSDDSEYLKVTQYPPAFDGVPRAPVVLNYICEVTGGGVNPFL